MSSFSFMYTGKCWSLPCLMELDLVVMVLTLPNYIQLYTFRLLNAPNKCNVKISRAILHEYLRCSAVFETVLQVQPVVVHGTQGPAKDKEQGPRLRWGALTCVVLKGNAGTGSVDAMVLKSAGILPLKEIQMFLLPLSTSSGLFSCCVSPCGPREVTAPAQAPEPPWEQMGRIKRKVCMKILNFSVEI